MVAARNRLLPRAPRRADQMMVQHGNAKGVTRALPQAFLCQHELSAANAARLVPPRANGVEPNHMERRGRVGRLRSLPLVLEGLEGARETRRKGVGNVVISRDRQDGADDVAEEL